MTRSLPVLPVGMMVHMVISVVLCSSLDLFLFSELSYVGEA